MSNVKIIDEHIGEILQLLNKTAGLFRDLNNTTENYEQEFKEICNHLSQLWYLREQFYEKNPELPPFALHQESQENIQRVNQLQKIASAISKEYQHKRFQAASELAEELLEKAEHGFFKELAQSWLFRCKAHQEQSFDLTLSKYEVPVEDLENLYQSAQEIEKQKNFALAKTHYEQLVRISKFSQYEMKGQAGIYRTSLAIKEN